MSSSSDDELTTSRRTLLKGAVAAGVGVAAYSSPIVSSVPVYATHGLSSYSSQSNVLCIWFSPNHQEIPSKSGNKWGDWHPGFALVANVYNNNTIDSHDGLRSKDTWNAPFTVQYYVGAKMRSVQWGGHPNNITYNGQDPSNIDQVVGEYPEPLTGAIIDNPGDGYHGGGIKIKLLDPKCEFLWIASYNVGKDTGSTPVGGCTQIGTASTSWDDGNSSGPITPSAPPNGAIPNPWQGDATRTVYYHTGQERKENNSPWSMFFKIRCND